MALVGGRHPGDWLVDSLTNLLSCRKDLLQRGIKRGGRPKALVCLKNQFAEHKAVITMHHLSKSVCRWTFE